MSRFRAVLAAIAAAALIAGCGDDDDEQPAPERPAETVHSVPELPRGWEIHSNRAGGFAFGLPPGWKARDRGTTTEVRSFDGLVVLSVAADRTDEAVAIEPAEAATRTLESLEALAERADPGEARKFDHRYEAYEVSGRGRSGDAGVEQNLTIVVLRRDGAVSVTVLIAANADERAKPARRIAERVVGTLRTQPPSR